MQVRIHSHKSYRIYADPRLKSHVSRLKFYALRPTPYDMDLTINVLRVVTKFWS
ncbi:hypothetical protein Psch_04219 [Pelotomaculum schinkii]|uniref:Uncharacterized protein n=1 Tax=Pelotomaculum schinkii TaxID=78350 RepID=A0A4Y7R650_9FIRM|nr:hypothetical protein Psch_04219 [Pelotomaculum schinkii]